MTVTHLEGAAFLVPLRDGGFARGVVARSAPGGRILLGYFFGPRLPTVEAADFNGLKAANSILSLRFGDLALLKGIWPVLGSMPNWNKEGWPMLRALRRDPLGMRHPLLVAYDDHDPSKVIAEHPTAALSDLPTDALAGYAFVEAKLSKLLPT